MQIMPTSSRQLNQRVEKNEGSIIGNLTDTSPIVINVPTRGLLAVETRDA